MAKNTRLSRGDFVAAGRARRIHGTLFSLAVSPLPPDRRSSSACVVSKKVAAKAVQRNLIKRRCREAVRARMRTFLAKNPLALVFRAKNTAKNAEFGDIVRDVVMLIDKVSDTRYNAPQ